MGKKYIDGRGWQYQMMPGIAAPPWRLTEEGAQADLDQMAAKKGWTEMEDCEDE